MSYRFHLIPFLFLLSTWKTKQDEVDDPAKMEVSSLHLKLALQSVRPFVINTIIIECYECIQHSPQKSHKN